MFTALLITTDSRLPDPPSTKSFAYLILPLDADFNRLQGRYVSRSMYKDDARTETWSMSTLGVMEKNATTTTLSAFHVTNTCRLYACFKSPPGLQCLPSFFLSPARTSAYLTHLPITFLSSAFAMKRDTLPGGPKRSGLLGLAAITLPRSREKILKIRQTLDREWRRIAACFNHVADSDAASSVATMSNPPESLTFQNPDGIDSPTSPQTEYTGWHRTGILRVHQVHDELSTSQGKGNGTRVGSRTTSNVRFRHPTVTSVHPAHGGSASSLPLQMDATVQDWYPEASGPDLYSGSLNNGYSLAPASHDADPVLAESNHSTSSNIFVCNASSLESAHPTRERRKVTPSYLLDKPLPPTPNDLLSSPSLDRRTPFSPQSLELKEQLPYVSEARLSPHSQGFSSSRAQPELEPAQLPPIAPMSPIDMEAFTPTAITAGLASTNPVQDSTPEQLLLTERNVRERSPTLYTPGQSRKLRPRLRRPPGFVIRHSSSALATGGTAAIPSSSQVATNRDITAPALASEVRSQLSQASLPKPSFNITDADSGVTDTGASTIVLESWLQPLVRSGNSPVGECNGISTRSAPSGRCLPIPVVMQSSPVVGHSLPAPGLQVDDENAASRRRSHDPQRARPAASLPVCLRVGVRVPRRRPLPVRHFRLDLPTSLRSAYPDNSATVAHIDENECPVLWSYRLPHPHSSRGPPAPPTHSAAARVHADDPTGDLVAVRGATTASFPAVDRPVRGQGRKRRRDWIRPFK